MDSRRKPWMIVVRLFTLLALLLGGLPLRPASALDDEVPGWLRQTAADPADTSVRPALAIDSLGRPHVAYAAPGQPYQLVYRYYDGSAWQDGWSSPGGAESIDIALDSADRVHITFVRMVGNDKALFHAYWSGGSMVIERVTTQQNSGLHASMVLDDADRPQVAYFNGDDRTLEYAYFDGVSWQRAALATAGSNLFFSNIALALDAQERPRIAYCSGSPMGTCAELFYLAYDGPASLPESLETGPTGYATSLVMDAAGQPILSYSKSDDGALMVRTHDANGWQVQTLAAGGQAARASDLALGSDGYPRIAYHDQPSALLKYGVFDGTAWQIETASSNTNHAQRPALGLDARSKAHIVSLDSNAATLEYVGQPPMADLTVQAVWRGENGKLMTAFHNAGAAPANGFAQVDIAVDGEPHALLASATAALNPGDTLPIAANWSCSGNSDSIAACAYIDGVSEIYRENNCLAVVIPCDTSAPRITKGPRAISEQPTTAVITWNTNEATTSLVRYGWREAVYDTQSSATPLTEHSITLTHLQPATTYSFTVRSSDGAGLSVESHKAYFRTQALDEPAGVPTSFTSQRIDPQHDNFNLSVHFADPSKVQKVSFLVDGKLIGSAFSASGGDFGVELNPIRHWPDRQQFYRPEPKEVQVQVTALNGQVTNYPYTFSPGSYVGRIDAYFTSPEAGRVLYIPSSPSPSRIIPVQLYASQFAYDCEWASGSENDCAALEQDVQKASFYVDNILKAIRTSPSNTHTYSFDWNIEGLSAGMHTLRADVSDAQGSIKQVSQQVKLEVGQANLSITRQVTRVGPRFNVTLQITNAAPEGIAITLERVDEKLVGFQAVSGTADGCTLVAVSGENDTLNQMQIDPHQKTLNPNQTFTVHYSIVPILYQEPASVQHAIGFSPVNGAAGTEITFRQGSVTRKANLNQQSLAVSDASAPNGTTNLAAAVSKAYASSDYLLISSPHKMRDLGWSSTSVSSLMGTMGELALLKYGIVVYWPANASKDSLNALLEDNSVWSNRLHPNFEVRGKGYVLLVGESEVIPSYTTGPYSVDWGDGTEAMYVHYADNPYAHTDGNGAPDLLLGRIVGNQPDDLEKALRTSINHHRGMLSNDMSHVYLGSGVGNLEETMQSDANSSGSYLASRGMVSSVHHWETEGWLRVWDYAYEKYDGLTAADLDGDGRDEIALASRAEDKVFVFDGDSGQLLSFFGLDFELGDGFAAGDVDNDGRDELVHGDRADKIQVFGLENGQWKLESSFTSTFASGDGLAVGDVVQAHAGDEIVKARHSQDTITIYDQNGSIPLPVINMASMGHPIAPHQSLAVGNLGVTAAVDELLIQDIDQNKLVIIGSNGTLVKEIDADMQVGDVAAVGDITDNHQDEIVLSSATENNVLLYRGNDSDTALAYSLMRSIYKDVEPYDGLITRHLPGSSNDEIVFADRSHDRFVVLDPYYAADNIREFVAASPNQDLMWFMAHGSANSMGPSVAVGNLPANFGSTAPIINAFSCNTGNYEGASDEGLVEAFFDAGAGGYLGSTEVSPVQRNSNASRKLYSEFWDPGESLLQAVRQLKQNRWEVSEYYDFWWLMTNEYNYYGDPKFEKTSPAQIVPAQASALGMAAQELTLTQQTLTDGWADGEALQGADLQGDELQGVSSVTVDLSALEITSQDGIDRLEIAHGDEYLAKDQPIVPIYVAAYAYPAGVTVQDVQLQTRSNHSTYSNLVLPTANMEPTGAHDDEQTPALADGWTPGADTYFTWNVNNEPDGPSTLYITIYPLRYHALTRVAEYDQHFVFLVTTANSDTAIVDAHMSAPQYAVDDPLSMQVLLKKEGSAQPRVLTAALRKLGSGAPVGGFPVTMLATLTGEVSVELTLTRGGLDAGDYVARVEVQDLAGMVQDWREVTFRVGREQAVLENLAANQVFFTPGDSIAITGLVRSSGDLPLDAQLVVRVTSAADPDYAFTQTQAITALAAGSSTAFHIPWNSSGAPLGISTVSVYLTYDSQTSPVAQVILSTNVWLYLPMVRH